MMSGLCTHLQLNYFKLNKRYSLSQYSVVVVLYNYWQRFDGSYCSGRQVNKSDLRRLAPVKAMGVVVCSRNFCGGSLGIARSR